MQTASQISNSCCMPTGVDLDDARFRQVLSHYPTGVVIITAITDDGEPIGMVVGSFTSVSLRPPLVAFLADSNSRTYGKLKRCRAFVINMLAADQERLCRQFSSKSVTDKWADVSWLPTANGIRKIAGAVAHVECSHEATHVAGDHDIVLCRVEALEVVNPALPLLFFQGAYGRFVPQGFVVPSQVEAAAPLRLADLARPCMESLSKEFEVECVAQAKIGAQLVFLAATGGSPASKAPLIGHRIPHVPPLGMLYAAWQGRDAVEAWLGDTPARNDLLGALERIRRRGYSLALETEAYGPLERVRDRFSNGLASPADERFLRDMASALVKFYEPAELPQAGIPVRMVGAPVFTADGSVGLVLQLWNPVRDPDRPLARTIERLLQVTQQLSRDIAAKSAA